MIYISEDQLGQVEYLIGQSIQGNHVLFDTDTVRRVFKKAGPECTPLKAGDTEAYGVEHHIEKLMVMPGLHEKRAYLDQLDSATFDLVVRTYFNIVENNLFESAEVKH